MKLVLDFESNKERYSADACIIWCSDDRFSQALDSYIAERGFRFVDLVKIAGGVKDLASSADANGRAYLLAQIGKTIKFSEPKELILMTHAECDAFEGSEDEAMYESTLARAADAVREEFPDMPIKTLYVDFDGIFLSE